MAKELGADKRGLEVLSQSECQDLLSQGLIGRLGLLVSGEPLILPVLYRFADGAVVFRTAPGEKLDKVWINAPAAFEVDDWDADQRTGWSVLVRGPLDEVVDADELAALEELNLEIWTPKVADSTWARIRPTSITGRRIA